MLVLSYLRVVIDRLQYRPRAVTDAADMNDAADVRATIDMQKCDIILAHPAGLQASITGLVLSTC